MFQALLAYVQETLHKRKFGDYCVLKLISSCREGMLCCAQPTSTTSTYITYCIFRSTHIQSNVI
jgi:hypothetical protein